MKSAVVLFAALLGLSQAALSSNTLFIYPAAGQSDEQLAKDRYQCYRWAVDQSGIDPNTLSTPSTKQTAVRNENHGDGAKGTVIGTLAGAALGNAIDGHTPGTVHGAIIGATLGTAIGNDSEHQGAKEAREKAQAQANEKARAKQDYQANIQDYNRAFSACMESRNYTVR